MMSLAALLATALVPGPWSDTAKTPAQRAAALLNAMTLDEKIVMTHGPASGPCCQCPDNATCAYVGNVANNTRLGIPPLTMNDGPQGFRDNVSPGTTTAWPSGLTMAASWDADLMHEWGAGMGAEFYAKGSNVQLGPGLCIARVPRNGRNFEYLSGEDPFLGYKLVQPVIRGIQSKKVIANAKHWVMNNQETNRMGVSEDVDEATRFELYYPPFAGAIEAGVGSVMCSYNKINGAWSCENPQTLQRELKELEGFEGFVMSDWGATHSTSLMAGLDIEMPSADFMNAAKIKAGLANGTITEAALNASVTRTLRAMFAVGVMDEPAGTWDWSKLTLNTTTEASVASARRLSAASTVLLKNADANGDAVLPLSAPCASACKIAVLGFATSNAVVHAGGSGSVVPSYISQPLDAIRAAAGAGATVTYADGSDLTAASALAAAADVAIVFVATLSSEGADRVSLSLDDGCDKCGGPAAQQNALVAAAAKANAKTIVVASVPGAVLMPWSGSVAAILTNFMPGQQAGNAIADVLFGRVNPSGKLPLTMPNMENETALTPAQWPGLPDPSNPEHAAYSERLLVGYRYYDAKGLNFTTGFPFGHGISYTQFLYSDLKVSPSRLGGAAKFTVSFTLTNTGKVAGAEVAQLYVGVPAADHPPKSLKGFEKVPLEPGASTRVEMPLSAHDLSVWDATAHEWSEVTGSFPLYVGASSRDIRLTSALANAPAVEAA